MVQVNWEEHGRETDRAVLLGGFGNETSIREAIGLHHGMSVPRAGDLRRDC
jgi:hypothetical protein